MSRDDPFRLAIMAGRAAKAAGTTRCPYPVYSALAICWQHGRQAEDQAVPRETVTLLRRTEAEDHAMRTLLRAGATQRLVADVLGRTHDATRRYISRQRKRAA